MSLLITARSGLGFSFGVGVWTEMHGVLNLYAKSGPK